MVNKQKTHAGFTIVETTIVLAFLSILTISIVYVGIFCGKMYSKGVTLKSINQAGREIADQIRRDVVNSQESDIRVVIQGNDATGQVGRICLGSVSYLWNDAKAMSMESTTKISYPNGHLVRLARISDRGGQFCEKQSDDYYPVEISSTAEYKEMVGNDSENIMIYRLYMGDNLYSSSGSSSGMRNLSFDIGTGDFDVVEFVENEEYPNGKYMCRLSGSEESNFNYCAIERFDTKIRSGGSSL